MISLERNPAYTDHNIPLKSEHYYRGLTVDSVDDLWELDENGAKVMKGYGKGGTDRLSFQKSFPNNLYVNGLVQANTIIEGDASLPIEQHETRSGYTFVSELEKDKVEAGEIRLRIWRRELGAGALNAVHTWNKIYDTFPSEHDAQDTPAASQV